MKSRLFFSSRLFRKMLILTLLNGVWFVAIKTVPKATAQEMMGADGISGKDKAQSPEKPPKPDAYAETVPYPKADSNTEAFPYAEEQSYPEEHSYTEADSDTKTVGLRAWD